MEQSEFVPGVGELKLIGRGGTAAVFRSEDRATGLTVAVKVLNARLTDPTQITRFERDVDAVQTLNGERSVVEILTKGVNDSGHPWIVTPYLPSNLASVLAAHGPLPWREVAAVGVQVADALAAAHQRGVLHGDLKPGDIRFDDRGIAQLADLGLARYAGTSAPNPGVGDPRLAHCAPEVVSGKPLDERSDVYSLASILVEAITGAPAFGRLADQGAPALVDRILSETAAPLTRFGVPAPLDDLLHAALAKDPSRRPQSAALFADSLAAAARTTHGALAVTTFTADDRPGFSSVPSVSDEIPFDELDTPADGYPLVDQFPVLDAVEAAPLLAAAGRRERRRRRERRVASVVVVLALLGGTVAGGVVWLTGDNGTKQSRSNSVVPAVTEPVPEDASVPGTDALQPVSAIAYSFTASFDTKSATAMLTGVASPTGAARLKNALVSVGRLDNELEVQDGPEPDNGLSVDDAITLLASMRSNLTAGTLSFDGQTFSLSGFYRAEAGRQDIQDVISLIRTPVARPDLSLDPDAAAQPTSSSTSVVGSGSIAITASTTTFTIPGDGKFHILPVTLRPTGGSTQLCLSARTVTGTNERGLVMNYSSCGLARIVTLSSSIPGTYTVVDTFTDERGPSGPTGTVTFLVVVT